MRGAVDVSHPSDYGRSDCRSGRNDHAEALEPVAVGAVVVARVNRGHWRPFVRRIANHLLCAANLVTWPDALVFTLPRTPEDGYVGIATTFPNIPFDHSSLTRQGVDLDTTDKGLARSLERKSRTQPGGVALYLRPS